MKEIPGVTVGENDSIGKQMLRIALRRYYSLYTCNVCRIRYEPYRDDDNGECQECSKQTGPDLQLVHR
jgi:hypothetical protein